VLKLVEKEVMDLIQIFSWVATATGVCFAAYYYVITLRNTEKIKRRDLVFQKLNLNLVQLMNTMYYVRKMVDWDTLEEFSQKYSYWKNTEAFSNLMIMMNYFNLLGWMMKDKIVTAEEVFELVAAGYFKNFYEKFKPWLDDQGGKHLPSGERSDNYYDGIHFLYSELIRTHPNGEWRSWSRSLEEEVERRRRPRETVGFIKK
jgi:hypothetical protein